MPRVESGPPAKGEGVNSDDGAVVTIHTGAPTADPSAAPVVPAQEPAARVALEQPPAAEAVPADGVRHGRAVQRRITPGVSVVNACLDQLTLLQWIRR